MLVIYQESLHDVQSTKYKKKISITLLNVHRSILRRMKNISDKCCRENLNTFYIQRRFYKNRAVYEIMWKNIVEPERPQMTIWRMRLAC